MRRHFFTISSALSLLLGVAAGVLWVRSYWRCDVVLYRYSPASCCGLSTHRGTLYFRVIGTGAKQRFEQWFHNSRWMLRAGYPVDSDTPTQYDTCARFAGFAFGRFPNGGPDTLVGVPPWAVLVVAGVLPCLYLRQHYRLCKRRDRGLCLVCGYDLRASMDRCPECGTAIPANAKQYAEPSSPSKGGQHA